MTNDHDLLDFFQAFEKSSILFYDFVCRLFECVKGELGSILGVSGHGSVAVSILI